VGDLAKEKMQECRAGKGGRASGREMGDGGIEEQGLGCI